MEWIVFYAFLVVVSFVANLRIMRMYKKHLAESFGNKPRPLSAVDYVLAFFLSLLGPVGPVIGIFMAWFFLVYKAS
jgi:hypothetical protein